MTADVRIRDVTVGDLPALREMLVATWHATYDPIYGAARVTEITNRWHSVANLEAGLRPGRVALLAERDGVVVGHVYVSLLEGTGATAKLWRLYVRPDDQGCGLGRLLLDAGFSRAPTHTRRLLEVEPDNIRAIGFYRHNGFMEIERSPPADGQPGAVVMAWPA